MSDTMNVSDEGAVDGSAVRRDVLTAFQYAHHEKDWVFPLTQALNGVTAEDAAWVPDPGAGDAHSIWQIVLHMTVWTENIVERMGNRERGEKPGRPAEGAWPALPDRLDDRAWEAAQRRLWSALAALQSHIATTPIAALLDQGNFGYSQLADLLCRLVHNAYHIGQITKIRDWKAAANGIR